MNWLSRTELLIGKDSLMKLQSKHVLVVGLGGVGAYTAEQLCRAGIGEMTIVDADVVDETNLNRQLIALQSTKGMPKSEIVAQRLRDINPDIKLHIVQEFIRNESIDPLLESAHFDYVCDAIDSLAPKVFLIHQTLLHNYPLISAMGAGGKMDPAMVQVVDIKKTYQCKLAFTVRKRLHHLGVRSGFKAVFSPEIVPDHAVVIDSNPAINKLSVVGTISYMPAIFGCYMASEVIRDFIK
ncbi:MAG TPA: tRNA threonylcarbamoyladenosine dehydratase [Bacteroidales bacterium]|jgi:tRNA A37 threonylcarbamoyladenosine dehydratase|nr:tRNA threonylcarbamoyladenosine dehydratase [Bacteroidales bacterium]